MRVFIKIENKVVLVIVFFRSVFGCIFFRVLGLIYRAREGGGLWYLKLFFFIGGRGLFWRGNDFRRFLMVFKFFELGDFFFWRF